MQEQPEEQPAEPNQPGAGASEQQQAALVQLGKMMGPQTDEFDEEVQALHDKRHQAEHDATDYEKVYGGEAEQKKMRAAQSGGAGPGLGPTEAEEALAKQQQTLQQQAAAQGQQQAAQAQTKQTSPTPPPAPTTGQGVTQPYPAQAGPQPPPAPAPEEEGQ